MTAPKLRQLPAPCWGIRRRDNDQPYNPDHDVHYDTAGDCQAEIRTLGEEEPGTAGQLVPRLVQSEPCWLIVCPSCGEDYGDDEWAWLHLLDRAIAERHAADAECDSCGERLAGVL